MKKKKFTKIFCFILATLAVISNLILIGFDFDSYLFDINWRIFIFNNYYEELMHIISSFCVIISIVFISKTKLLLLFSFGITVITELLRFVYVLNINSEVYSYTNSVVVYNLIAFVVLTIAICMVFVQKIDKRLIFKLSNVCIVFYIIVCVIPVVLFDSYINISLTLYYISTYALYGVVTQVEPNNTGNAFLR